MEGAPQATCSRATDVSKPTSAGERLEVALETPRGQREKKCLLESNAEGGAFGGMMGMVNVVCLEEFQKGPHRERVSFKHLQTTWSWLTAAPTQ